MILSCGWVAAEGGWSHRDPLGSMDASRFLQRSKGRVHPISDTSHFPGVGLSSTGWGMCLIPSLDPGCTSQDDAFSASIRHHLHSLLRLSGCAGKAPACVRVCNSQHARSQGWHVCHTLRETKLRMAPHSLASFPSGLSKDLRTFIKSQLNTAPIKWASPIFSPLYPKKPITGSDIPLSQRFLKHASELLIIAMGNPTLIYTN